MKTKGKIVDKTAQDGFYLLKITLYLLVGSLWLKVSSGVDLHLPIPLGLLIGILFVKNEKLQIDRKIDYAVLLVASIIGFWLPYGLYIQM